MGGICSKGTKLKGVRAREASNGVGSGQVLASFQEGSTHLGPPFSGELKRVNEVDEEEEEEEIKSGQSGRSLESGNSFDRMKLSRVLSSKAKTARTKTTTVAKKGAAKVSEVGMLLGRAGTMGLGKAVEALDTVGSSITTIGSGFGAGITPKGTKIGILAFEVANTIVRGFNLMHSLSDEDIKVLKEEILPSEGVQRLVSRDTEELWRIAAADKRGELKVFTREVVRFGNLCRDPRWHHLCRVFSRLGSEVEIPAQSKEAAEGEMENLMVMAQHTAELYHELHALDRFQNDLKRKVQQEEELYTASQRGESMTMLKSDLKAQQRHVKNMKKKSLWSKILEEVMEKLVDVVYYLHQRIHEIFQDAEPEKVYVKDCARLGSAGLALHYSNIINQIDNLVSRPSSVPPNTRDTLYQGLPPSIKAALRSRLQMPPKHDELTIPQIKAEMEKILDWLAPVAVNTTRAHHGFGWVGEWANSGSVMDRRLPGHTELIRLQTLHHAEQSATESYILELVVWLNVLVCCARSNINGPRSPLKSPNRSPIQRRALEVLSSGNSKNSCSSQSPAVLQRQQQQQVEANGDQRQRPRLSQEDEQMLKEVVAAKRRLPGISKSQEFVDTTNRSKACSRLLSATNRLSKSNSHSPSTAGGRAAAPEATATTDSVAVTPTFHKRHSANSIPTIDLDIDRINDFEINSLV